MDKVYIVGSSGYIGTKLCGRLNRKFMTGRIDLNAEIPLDLRHPQKFNYDMLSRDTIIFTAAVSSPDKCAENYGQASAVNVSGTKFFIGEAIKRCCRVLFFSSDAVYGFYSGIADEKTDTAGATAYGKMKKEVEDQFKGSNLFKALRLSYVFSMQDKYTSYLLDCAAQGKTAEIYHPFYRNAVSAMDVMDAVEWLIIHWEEFCHPFLNLCGQELISRIRIADEVKKHAAPELTYQIKFPGNAFFINRPAALEMRSLYLDKIIDTQERFTEKIEKLTAWEGEAE